MEELYNLIYKLEHNNIIYSKFEEPDIDNELTSICFMGNDKSKHITKKYKLST